MMMNKAASVVLLLLVAVSCAQKADKPYRGPSEADVVELQPSNIDDVIGRSSDTWLLYMYAPWCGHCTTMRPEWAKLATSLKDTPNLKVAKVDPSDNSLRPKFHKKYKLVSFPHIVIIPAGQKADGVYDIYEGARTADSIKEWAFERIKAHKALAVNRVVDQSVWQESCVDTSASICVIALLPSLLDSSPQQRTVYLEIVRTVANSFRDKPASFVWAQAGDHPEFETLFNLNSGFPAVVLINPGRRVFTTMKAALTEEAMLEWIEEVFRSKGGRRFNRYNGEIAFNTLAPEEDPQVEIDSQEGEL